MGARDAGDLMAEKSIGHITSELEPESSRTYEAGLSALNTSLTYFHTDFTDKIIVDYLTDGSGT